MDIGEFNRRTAKEINFNLCSAKLALIKSIVVSAIKDFGINFKHS
jgi:hypothetical protein